jgi:exosortase A
MLHSAAIRKIGTQRFALPKAWRAALWPALAAWAMLALVFAADWARIAAIAWNSSTFNHILLIPAILGWLVWQRAPELAKIVPQAWWPGLVLSAGGASMWLLGAVSGVDLARQLGAVAMLVSTVPLLLGARVAAALVFPLCYAFLLVPMGEELVPALQLFTAKITVALVTASGIPAHIEGVFIDTPAGLFEVAESCSGVKFLIAMVALGLLVANVCFRSWKRRVVFLTACVIVPILANGVRAFATIWIAQSIGAERAVGIDHIIYGWFFFAIVVAILLAGAWRFFDRSPLEPMADVDRIAASPLLARMERYRAEAVPALVAMAVLGVGVLGWAKTEQALLADLPGRIALPEIQGWQRVDGSSRGLGWNPRAEGADRRLLGRYRDAQGREVDVFLALYARQGEGREPGGFGQGALPPASGWSWHSNAQPVANGKAEFLRGDDGTLRFAATWYVSGPLVTGSNARLKLQSVADGLLLRARPTAMLIVSASGKTPAQARETAVSFIRLSGPPRRWMDRLAISG